MEHGNRKNVSYSVLFDRLNSIPINMERKGIGSLRAENVQSCETSYFRTLRKEIKVSHCRSRQYLIHKNRLFSRGIELNRLW